MAGGQQISSSQGTLIGLGGDNNQALSGSASTGTAGDPGKNALVPLRSKKTGTGSATAALTGRAATFAQGTLIAIKSLSPVLTGSVATFAQGTLLYRGQAMISWNANTEPDLARYRVLHGTTSLGENEFVDVFPPSTSYVWGGLQPGLTHYFYVEAVDTSGNVSLPSAEVSKAY